MPTARVDHMTTDQFIKALALKESGDNPNAPLGDHGRAVGRWQTHPDWVFWASRQYGIAPVLDETWDSFICRLVRAFYQERAAYYATDIIAMTFHMGHVTYRFHPDWDSDYASQFQECVNKVLEA